jgi:hypothetical protein
MKMKTARRFLAPMLLVFVAGCATPESRWKEAQSADTLAAYTDFLAKVRTGPLADQARTRIETLHFQKAANANSIAAYEEFLRRYPKGANSVEARSRLEVLHFQQARETNSAKAYQDFLKAYPHGALVEEAQARQAMAAKDLSASISHLTKFPDGKYADELLRHIRVEKLGIVIPDRKLIVALTRVAEWDWLDIPTGSFTLSAGGITSETKTRKAAKGNKTVEYTMIIGNYGAAFDLTREGIGLRMRDGKVLAPIDWSEPILGVLIQSRAEVVKIAGPSKINFTVEIPQYARPEEVTFQIAGKPVASMGALLALSDPCTILVTHTAKGLSMASSCEPDKPVTLEVR